MSDRSMILEGLRSELVGPQLIDHFPPGHAKLHILDVPLELNPNPECKVNKDHSVLFHTVSGEQQEVVWFRHEPPHKRYGAGLLYPNNSPQEEMEGKDDQVDNEDLDKDLADDQAYMAQPDEAGEEADISVEEHDDIEIAARDRYKPSTIGISFHARLPKGSNLKLILPKKTHLAWQTGDKKFPVNGWYRKVTIKYTYEKKDGSQIESENQGYARYPVAQNDIIITINSEDLEDKKIIERAISVPEAIDLPKCPIKLAFRLYPRKIEGDEWLITVILENKGDAQNDDKRQQVLFQAHFEVEFDGETAKFLPYPESHVNFDNLTAEEQDLELLYREQPIWGTGHGCAAGWDHDHEEVKKLRAEVMPAVETPSMTPDLFSDGKPIKISLHELITDGRGALKKIKELYGVWINSREKEVDDKFPDGHKFRNSAKENIKKCNLILNRIDKGIQILEGNGNARRAFELANHAMLLQSLATKNLKPRLLAWDRSSANVIPSGCHDNPDIQFNRIIAENPGDLPSWRAFQIAFLLMSLAGVVDKKSDDREIVDIIWFPTGGGKTEAYLAVAAFTMFYERLSGNKDNKSVDVLMRYTLRMLTTQQFQRSAALICAMEWLRSENMGSLGEHKFSLGLWIGETGSPNTIVSARTKYDEYKSNKYEANPFVLSECPWCRAEIGKCNQTKPRGIANYDWIEMCVRGIEDKKKSIVLRCPDSKCFFYNDGETDNFLPIDVIDEQIYNNPPSFLIGTVDKFAMLAYEPKARTLFGYKSLVQRDRPPVLILQDELHLISGPLGTMYAMYEGVIEKLCTDDNNIRPKVICSTATIRGAGEQVKAIFNRENITLFPRPAVTIGDSFFGVYARDGRGKLCPGRLYLGINATNTSSFQTVQVRNFSRVLQIAAGAKLVNRDPWWTLLLFYNSLRELGGASTLFSGDIRSRLSFLKNRDGIPTDYRTLKQTKEISSRLQQGDLSRALDQLNTEYSEKNNKAIDVAVASNIIEVGVDIPRLSLLGVLGQPKSTAQYIQVTGRVGRKWEERPGLVMMLYNSSKARDLSHFEQFYSYHSRLYERVEPTSATPFTSSAIRRALGGLIVAYIRQNFNPGIEFDDTNFETAMKLISSRAEQITGGYWRAIRPILEKHATEIKKKWDENVHDCWNKWTLGSDDRPVIRTFDQYAEFLQREEAFPVPTSMRQVDRAGGALITRIKPEHIKIN